MTRTSPRDEDISEVYIDETSQTAHRWLIIGGLIVPKCQSERLSHLITEVKERHGIGREMKWGRVSQHYLEGYREIVDLFIYQKPPIRPLDFHALAVDTSRRNEVAFNNGSREIGFNKEIYQLAQKFRRLYPDTLFHIYPDFRNSPQANEETRLILNRGASMKGDGRDWPFRRLHMLRSKRTPILQLVDILLGGLAYKMNGHFEAPGASAAKIDLSSHILKYHGIRDPHRDTHMRGKFTIWHRRLR